MKAVQIFERGRAEFVELPMPEVPEGCALIRPKLLSLCASDVHMLHYSDDHEYPLPPGVSGHELVGVVEQINGNHDEVQVGDLTLTIVPALDGMAEYFVAPFKDVLPVPDGVAPEHLAQAQQLGTVIYACNALPNLQGQNVAVVGQGSAGLWFNFMLKRLGARTIVALDLLDHRLALSKQFGATYTINNSKEDAATALKNVLGGELPDVVIEAVGEDDTINLCIELCKQDGFMLQFGVPHSKTFAVDYYEMFRKCLTLKSVVGAASEPNHQATRTALKMIARGDVDVAPILTHRFPFEQVIEAYELQRVRTDGAVKILIDMPT